MYGEEECGRDTELWFDLPEMNQFTPLCEARGGFSCALSRAAGSGSALFNQDSLLDVRVPRWLFCLT